VKSVETALEVENKNAQTVMAKVENLVTNAMEMVISIVETVMEMVK
jgi:hypothetical protein